MSFKKSIFILVFLIFPIGLFAQSKEESPKLIFFQSLSCHKCIKVKSEFMPEVEARFSNKIQIDYRDIGEIENYKLMLGLKEQYGVMALKELPIVFFAEHFLSGEEEIKKELIPLVESAIKKPPKEKSGIPFDLISHFRTFTPLAVISAGLVDGINPCAFTVIVFFLSFLAFQGYRKRELIAVGLAFIFTVFLTYVFIGVGLFGFLYRLKSFWLATKILNFSIGVFSIILGIFSLYDFFKFRKTKDTEGLILQLPGRVKQKIQGIIGWHYRKPKEAREQNLKMNVFKLVASALVCGFLVSILEAVCTGQVYLPTISFVLKTTHLKLEALGYLLLYNLMFITPLLIIFFLALLGVTSGQFAGFLKKHLLTVKILMAVLFFSLGIFLILRG